MALQLDIATLVLIFITLAMTSFIIAVDIRVSIGAAVFPGDGDSLDALLGAADASMYRDKNQHKQIDTPSAGALTATGGQPH